MSMIYFVLLSGAGWLLDLGLFWIGVQQLGLIPGVANFVSATIAAMAVYFVSSRLVFRGGQSGGKALVYFAYTEANIVFWALAIEALTYGLLSLGFGYGKPAAALIAKIGVTPLSLGCNYLVTRYLARRGQLAR